ncbi:MAG: type I restriction-modification system endonuclease [Bacteroidetes bacterium GWF2_43_63]|nr:MAG: type I restriction-modification system endonuclease [Bacteroidetes bacterium GWE2_42_42]OFY54514.1 MAG: type I restriction-modification system endonuclease [Bacteroidetes bacterium GWF2_43_63]HBG70464.1 type I restriction-modification system endonuclease [Bacteroidales bacterium]HCB63418.1 type I restriction-modification system endonuclease [Bacteroidales bacterium]
MTSRSENSFNSNFKFLEVDFSLLANIGTSAEFYCFSDPAVSLAKSRLFGEKLTELMFEYHVLMYPEKNDFSNRLRALKYKDILPPTITNLLYTIKDKGNHAVHNNTGTKEEAITILSCTFKVAKWVQGVYGKSKIDLEKISFIEPENHDVRHALQLLSKEFYKLEKEFAELKSKHETAKKQLSDAETKKLKEKAVLIASKIELDESETRIIIDRQLKDAGWEVDTQILNFKKNKTLPEKGKNLAIAEWPVGKLWADYALFCGLEFIGIIEAKKKGKDVISDLSQAQIYSKNAENKHTAILLGKWDDYNVPFMFSANGRPYHPQLEIKSGMWFLDGRKSTNHPKVLRNWFSPNDLKALFEKDIDKANSDLKEEPLDYLTDPNGLALRYYQLDAIEAVENAIANADKFDNRALVAMATGTGKTRTILGLCYRLLKTHRFKRILFLVDRNILGRQASDRFKDVIIEDLQVFSDIYDLKDLEERKPDVDTKIHFATVQGMVQRIFNSDDETPSIGSYDCIIVDEAHRGYILDREIDETLIDYKDQLDFMSKYKMVLDYFDAFRIGLTATPALHTTEIFGNPVYRYTYRDAVLDDYLVDHEPPYTIKTELNQKGIKWVKGERPTVYVRKTQSVEVLDALKDELGFDVEEFNKKVITEPFNKAILGELVNHIDPASQQKTLIYAASDNHADMVVDILIKEFEKGGIELENDAILKITGSVQKPTPQERVDLFRNERNPNIVVTVDLLTTGVDIPEICNLVFIRKVKSRILYEQMLGRATRKADHINKEVFKIFDAVDLYSTLEEFTTMKPVVTSVKTSLEGLVKEALIIKKKDVAKQVIDEIIARLNRRKNRIKDENLESFIKLSGGKTPEQFIKSLRKSSTAKAKSLINNHINLFRFLDKMVQEPELQFISEHPDQVQDVDRGYGEAKKPEDYIESFRKFITDNVNKVPALSVVCTKPKELSRQTLRELKRTLDSAGFTATTLNTAWKEARNEDIAADIISFVRTMALGSSLISHEERIKKAFQKIRGQHKWSVIQLKWLDRFEKQLLKENVLTKEDFNMQPFKADGGFDRINKIFNNELDTVLDMINQNLYQLTA